MTRFIVGAKPGSKATRLLKGITNARKIVNFARSRTFSRRLDFFVGYPPLNRVLFDSAFEAEDYERIRKFFILDKRYQRKELGKMGLPVPNTLDFSYSPEQYPDDTHFIRRPRRHTAGRNYKVLTKSQVTEEFDDNQRNFYYSPAYKKKQEYRIVLFKGRPVFTLIKKVPDTIDPFAPWNHQQGASFQTVRLMENNRLRNIPVGSHENIFKFLIQSKFFGALDFGALDIIVNKKNEECPMQILELNFCPSIDIPENQQVLRTIR